MKGRKTKILVFLLGSLGDSIISIPAFRALRSHYGEDAWITVLHERRDGLRVNPADIISNSVRVDEFVSYRWHDGRVARWMEYLLLGFKLMRGRYECAVNFTSSTRPKAAVKRDGLYFGWLGINRTVGFEDGSVLIEKEMGADGRVWKQTHETDFLLKRLERGGVSVRRAECLEMPIMRVAGEFDREAEEWMRRVALDGAKPMVAICPGTNMPSKAWPEDRFQAVCRWLQEEMGPELSLVFLGGKAERELCERVVGSMRRCHIAAGELSPMGSAALIRRCRLLFGLDTGTSHLAGVLGVPLVAIYSERNMPGQWDPLGVDRVLLRYGVPCQGCNLVRCDQPGHPCMMGVSVDQVIEAIQTVMKGEAKVPDVWIKQ